MTNTPAALNLEQGYTKDVDLPELYLEFEEALSPCPPPRIRDYETEDGERFTIPPNFFTTRVTSKSDGFPLADPCELLVVPTPPNDINSLPLAILVEEDLARQALSENGAVKNKTAVLLTVLMIATILVANSAPQIYHTVTHTDQLRGLYFSGAKLIIDEAVERGLLDRPEYNSASFAHPILPPDTD